MEIKPGKWKTRDSREATVLEIYEGKAFGRIRYASGIDCHPAAWSINGDSTNNNWHDLIAPWEEPKPRLRVWREKASGYIKICETKPEAPKTHVVGTYVVEEWQPVPELDALFERGEI